MEPALTSGGEPLAGRFRLGRCLGQGAFGVVHEALDLERGVHVALKRLSRVEPAALYRFKQEFRALADVSHPNLARLHELFSADDGWFLTMELVRGTDFLQRVRPSPEGARPVPDPETTITLGPADRASPVVRAATPLGVLDVDRLRDALAQLASAVAALHAAGKLHRDLKPSNVLVDDDGRVVVLDFGLVATVGATGHHLSIEQNVVGTPAYMAPEQAAGQAVSASADWYAVGVMLFEALTGRLPFAGSPLEILADKLSRDAIDPSVLVPDAPRDLCELAARLLRRLPAERPDDAQVVEATTRSPRDKHGAAIVAAEAPPAAAHSSGGASLVGREHHLRVLLEALDRTRSGRTTVALLHGVSGMGKTAILRHFLGMVGQAAERGASERAVVLEGRCFERESMPYKALDGVVDALTDHLRGLSADEVDRFMPRHVDALARVFPVLRRVAPTRAVDRAEPRELRRRAFAALRELLGRLAERRLVVVAVDDLQWGDLDSAELLGELLRPPDAPAIILVAAFRSEDRERSEVLRQLLGAHARGELGEGAIDLEVGPLSIDDARALATRLLDREDDVAARSIASESGGSPFFVQELVRWLESVSAGDGTGSRPTTVSLGSVLTERVRRLPENARKVLRVIAVAARPTAVSVVMRAAEIDETEGSSILGTLRAAHLVRTRTARRGDEIETFHDRIRETIAGALTTDELRTVHLRIAAALEADEEVDAERLLGHLVASGEERRARSYAEAAAERAAQALAFDRAAALYRQAIELDPETAPRELRLSLANALAAAGRGPEAGRAFLDLAVAATDEEGIDLRWRGAEQLLRSGHIDDGLEAVEDVLRAMGVTLARSTFAAIVGLVLGRVALRLRGLGMRERAESDVPADVLRRIDVCYAVGTGLSPVDMVRGTVVLTRHLRWALDAGEPFRASRALSAEASFAALTGASPQRASKLAERASEIARRIGHPHAEAYAAAAHAVTIFCDYRWRETVERCDEAIAVFRERCEGHTAWEEGSLDYCALRALAMQGQFRDIDARGPRCVKEAVARGDLFTATMLRVNILPWRHLAADRPADARDEVDRGIEGWSRRGFHVQHAMHGFVRSVIALYESDADAALAEMTALVPRIRGAGLHRAPHVRLVMHHVHARAALAAAARHPTHRDGLLALAKDQAKQLARDDRPCPQGFALLARAAIAHRRHDGVEARDRLAHAERTFERCEMPVYAAVAKRRRAELDGIAGTVRLEESDRALRALGVVRPERMTECLAPGFAPALALPSR